MAVKAHPEMFVNSWGINVLTIVCEKCSSGKLPAHARLEGHWLPLPLHLVESSLCMVRTHCVAQRECCDLGKPWAETPAWT